VIEAAAETTAPLVQSPLFLQTLTARLSPYVYNIFLLGLIPIAFIADVHTSSVWQQHLLGVGAWIILIVATRFSPKTERSQVWAMVAVSTCVEVWSSVVWGIYRYRYHNVPMFVPPGHGLVYLFALRAARTPIMLTFGRQAKYLALGAATTWMVFGLTLEPLLLHRVDVTGALFWPLFVWFMRKPSATIYAAAFFITSYLELWGTGIGNWSWQVLAPISHIPSGNPPSVIAAGYCVMDFTSIAIAARLASYHLPAWLSLPGRAAESAA
jgi:hypothetical protein